MVKEKEARLSEDQKNKELWKKGGELGDQTNNDSEVGQERRDDNSEVKQNNEVVGPQSSHRKGEKQGSMGRERLDGENNAPTTQSQGWS